jgi:hypothetical protein
MGYYVIEYDPRTNNRYKMECSQQDEKCSSDVMVDKIINEQWDFNYFNQKLKIKIIVV